MESIPPHVIQTETLLELHETAAIDAWGVSYRAAPEARNMARFLEDRFGMELVTDPAIVGDSCSTKRSFFMARTPSAST